MTSSSIIPIWRAVIASIALYALLLQPFIASATPVIAGAESAHCGPSTDDGSGKVPAGQAHQCCLAAQACSPGLPSLGEASSVRWPPVADVAVVYARLQVGLSATGPPGHAHSPRGPPSV